MRIGIIGATGYGGIELIRWLAYHPHVKITYLGSSSQAGTDIRSVYPHLESNYDHIEDTVLQEIDPDLIAQQVDFVFLSLPSGISGGIIPELLDRKLKVLDVGGDFRIKDASVHEAWYHKPAPDRKYQSRAIYGMTEFVRDQVMGADFVTNPGCYPTSVALGLIPALQGKFIKAEGIVIDAKSGTSGAGRSASVPMIFSEVHESIHAYKIGGHQHTPEIEQFIKEMTGHDAKVIFTPHLVPMTRGILSTIYGRLTAQAIADGATSQTIIDEYRAYYKGEKFVRVHDLGSFPKTKLVYGSNFCDIGIHLDERTGNLVIVSAIDNMVKGAAGQAIQNMNLMCGWPEETGLKILPMRP